MQLRSLHVDGYGALADWGSELAPGLVVVLGPNEAGKSTLRDFVTAMLFGFPHRRNDPLYRSPVRGGRHGGVVTLEDEDGGEWVIERHLTPQRSLVLRRPGGSPGSEADLQRVLGNASATLFRSVFAIGLDELGRIDTASTDEARELLFASSIFGERRSATLAIKSLNDAAQVLARPRKGDARANRLLRDLEENRAALAAARSEAAGYERMQAEVTRLEAEMSRRREETRQLRRRERELDALIACWPIARRAEGARTELGALPPEDPGAGMLAEVAVDLKELAAEVSGHQERAVALERLHRQAGGAQASLAVGLARLGTAWSEEGVRSALPSSLLAEQARELRRDLGERQRALTAAAAVLRGAAEALGELRADGARLDAEAARLGDASGGSTGSAGTEPPDAGTAKARREGVHELLERLAEIDELSSTIALHQVADERPRHAAASVVALALAVCCLGLAATAAVLAVRGSITGAIFLGVVALALGVVAVLSGRAPAREHVRVGGNATADDRRAPALVAERTVALERARARANHLAELLGLPIPASRVDVTRLDVRLRQHAEQRLAIDRHAETVRAAERRRAEADRILAAASEEWAGVVARFETWKQSQQFDEALDADGAVEAVAVLAEVTELVGARDRIANGIAELEPEVTSFARRCALVADRLGLADGPPTELESLRAWLEELRDRLESASALAGRRFALEDTISAAAADLERSLGSGSGADRLLGELAGGDVLAWRQESDEVTSLLDSLGAAEEAEVRSHQSATQALAELAGSDRIAQLEQDRAALESELDSVLTDFLVLGTARSLLSETLDRHQRERQPAVIAAAEEHFRRVTAGRYTGLVAEAGPEEIRVLTPTEASLDAGSLSRGTLEQLYLCLRLGLAASFAERGVALPLVLDDVLVNFDAGRAEAVAAELVRTSERHQVLFMTCHRQLADLMLEAAADHGAPPPQVVELQRL